MQADICKNEVCKKRRKGGGNPGKGYMPTPPLKPGRQTSIRMKSAKRRKGGGTPGKGYIPTPPTEARRQLRQWAFLPLGARIIGQAAGSPGGGGGLHVVTGPGWSSRCQGTGLVGFMLLRGKGPRNLTLSRDGTGVFTVVTGRDKRPGFPLVGLTDRHD